MRLANRDQIESVIVDGRLRLDRGWPVDWDGCAFLDRAKEVSRRVVANSPITRIDPNAAEHRARWMAERGAASARGSHAVGGAGTADRATSAGDRS